MKKITAMLYMKKFMCEICHDEKRVFYAVPDFGDAPIIMHCSNCGVLYYYTPENDYYIMPLEDKIHGLKCKKCNALLKETLAPTHKRIKCCNTEFSLDDNFAGHTIPPDTELVPVEVYLIYS